MSDASSPFTGLPMPVFTAFGWAGEENAIKFALSHLESFIQKLYPRLSLDVRNEFHHYGLSQEAQAVYLAVKRDIESGPYVLFNARPNTFEMKLTISDKAVVNRGLRSGEKDPAMWQALISSLGPSWHLNIQQYLVDEESGEASFYQDLYKDLASGFNPELSKEVTARAAFLNSETKWITPFHISYRIKSDTAAGMAEKIVDHMVPEVDKLLPILARFIHASSTNGRSLTTKNGTGRKTVRKTKTGGGRPKQVKAAEPKLKTFSHSTELKPLHMRKGFINLTPEHWPFFSTGARSETREVTVYYNNTSDKACSVWRLQPNDMARLVLSEKVQDWVASEFEPNTMVNINAVRMEDDEIQIRIQSD